MPELLEALHSLLNAQRWSPHDLQDDEPLQTQGTSGESPTQVVQPPSPQLQNVPPSSLVTGLNPETGQGGGGELVDAIALRVASAGQGSDRTSANASPPAYHPEVRL